ncbi:hypothetical protein [Methanoculleus sp.]|uniref:hypothetical protein n=1 Tax=Methanoculleus sp. TaxID=90427 RepID=UPI00260225DE|nr:hypothetical protein [Methanoculleus sp.]MDI6867855.1 hypothetical protein [Methanoculleus sp.]
MAPESAPAPGLVIDQETLDHLPAFHKAIAEVLIEKGRWQLTDSENKDSERTRRRHAPRTLSISREQ